MTQLAKKIPYLDSRISPAQSRVDIENLLNEAEIKDVRWTHVSGETTLEFVWHFEEKGIKKSVAFKFQPPVIQVKGFARKTAQGHGLGPIVWKRHEIAEWRLLWWYLKSRLEAVRFGIESMEQTFMSQVLISLPNGQQTTIGEIISEAIKTDQTTALKALPGMADIIPVAEQNRKPRIIEVSESGEINDAHES